MFHCKNFKMVSDNISFTFSLHLMVLSDKHVCKVLIMLCCFSNARVIEKYKYLVTNFLRCLNAFLQFITNTKLRRKKNNEAGVNQTVKQVS